jgi:hypothetical protein
LIELVTLPSPRHTKPPKNVILHFTWNQKAFVLTLMTLFSPLSGDDTRSRGSSGRNAPRGEAPSTTMSDVLPEHGQLKRAAGAVHAEGELARECAAGVIMRPVCNGWSVRILARTSRAYAHK